MKNFTRIAENILVTPLVAAVARRPDLWDQNTLRTKAAGSPHAEVSNIWLWFNPVDEKEPEKVIHDIFTRPYDAWWVLPQARGIVFDLMRMVEGSMLGRVIVTKLPPGGKIPPHKDAGPPAEFYTRYQVVLHSLPGNLFTINDETVQFKTGDVWMIDNRETHSVQNNSADDRIVMIVDIRSG